MWIASTGRIQRSLQLVSVLLVSSCKRLAFLTHPGNFIITIIMIIITFSTHPGNFITIMIIITFWTHPGLTQTATV